jgi:hypothetical protein
MDNPSKTKKPHSHSRVGGSLIPPYACPLKGKMVKQEEVLPY